jgi:hypothetical protein
MEDTDDAPEFQTARELRDAPARGPPKCQHCGHDPTGDADEFVSGGGWVADNEVVGGEFVDILRCPVCSHEVHREGTRL